jgi:hypothetical protein
MMGYQNNDKTDADPLTAWLDAGDRQPLRMACAAEVEASLRRLLNEQEAMAEESDSERLMRAAWALSHAGKGNGPAVAISWFKERPGHPRLAVVLGLLLVAWNRPPGTPPPDPASVETLLSVYESLNYDVVNENGLLIVLIMASKSGLPAPLEARVRGILEHARQVPDRQPEVKAQLDAFLNAKEK